MIDEFIMRYLIMESRFKQIVLEMFIQLFMYSGSGLPWSLRRESEENATTGSLQLHKFVDRYRRAIYLLRFK